MKKKTAKRTTKRTTKRTAKQTAAKKAAALDDYLYPPTIKEALKRWDAGRSLPTVEMGGLGPGYEQAIQVMAIEFLRAANSAKLPKDKTEPFEKSCNETMHKIDDQIGGATGAMFGAAQSLAWRFYTKGWKATIDSASQDRHIQVSKTFPQVTPPK